MTAIVFDLDGTLVDSAPDLHAAANRMLASLGRRNVSLAGVKSFIGNGVAKLVERCLAATGGSDDALQVRALAEFNTHYGAAPAVLTRPFEGVPEALRALHSFGFRMAVCTNKPEDMARAVLRQLGLGHFFDVVAGGAGLPLKPDPAGLLTCLAKPDATGSPRLFVGDSETDEATAVAAAVPFALFTGGYRKAPVEDFDALFRFDRFDQLAAKFVPATSGTSHPS